MSNDLFVQLHSYGDFFENDLPVLDADSVVAGNPLPVLIESRPPQPPPGKHPVRRLALAGAIVVAVVVTVIFAVQPRDESPPVITQVSTSLTPTTTPLLSSLTWSRVPHDEAILGGAGNQSMISVAAGGPGLVAVGSDELGGAAAWTSSDGITWMGAAAVPRRRTFSSDDRMESVTAGGPGLVGVGTSVWTSVDGIAWTLRDAGLTSHDAHAETGVDWQLMTSVTAGGPGLVAVGINWSDPAAGAVWTSVDGITWSRVPHDEAVFGSSVMFSVTVGGPGLVAVGIDNSNPDGDAGVWTSVDGITWSRVPNDESVFGGAGLQRMMSVTAGGPGLVAVGSEDLDEDFDAAVWTSVDGVVWSRVPHNESVFGGPSETMMSVTATGPGLVAVGANDAGPALWTSVDGTRWSRVPIDETAMGNMRSVTVGGPGLVAVGSTDGEGEDAVVWIGEDQ